jgi:hypothetical protein
MGDANPIVRLHWGARGDELFRNQQGTGTADSRPHRKIDAHHPWCKGSMNDSGAPRDRSPAMCSSPSKARGSKRVGTPGRPARRLRLVENSGATVEARDAPQLRLTRSRSSDPRVAGSNNPCPRLCRLVRVSVTNPHRSSCHPFLQRH